MIEPERVAAPAPGPVEDASSSGLGLQTAERALLRGVPSRLRWGCAIWEIWGGGGGEEGDLDGWVGLSGWIGIIFVKREREGERAREPGKRMIIADGVERSEPAKVNHENGILFFGESNFRRSRIGQPKSRLICPSSLQIEET